MLIADRESMMLYFRRRKHSSMGHDLRQKLAVSQEAEKGGACSSTTSCNFQKHLAYILDFFLLHPTMED